MVMEIIYRARVKEAVYVSLTRLNFYPSWGGGVGMGGGDGGGGGEKGARRSIFLKKLRLCGTISAVRGGDTPGRR